MESAKPKAAAVAIVLCSALVVLAVALTVASAMTWRSPAVATLSNSYVNATSVTCTLTGFTLVGGNTSASQERLWNGTTDTALLFPRNFTLPAVPTVRLQYGANTQNGTARARVLPSGDTDVSIRWPTNVTAPRNGSTACTISVVACVENASQPSTPTPSGGASYAVTGTITVRNRSANATLSTNVNAWPLSKPLTSNPTTVTLNSATPGTATPSAATTYQVAFTGTGPQTGRIAGNTAVGGNTITCVFPTGTVVPSTSATNNVTINGSNPASLTVVGQSVILRMPSSMTVTPTAQVQLVFGSAFGLINPVLPGTYTLALNDSAEVGTATVQYAIAYAVPRRVSLISASQPATTSVFPAQSLAVDGFNLGLTQSSVPATISAVSVLDAGSSPSSVISGVSVYKDDGDGVYDLGDTLLNSTPAAFVSTVATVTFDAARSQVLTDNAHSYQYWVVYSFSPSATDGQYATSKITTFTATSELTSLTAVQGNRFTVDTVPPTVAWNDPSVDSTTLVDATATVIGGTAADAGSGADWVAVKIQRNSDGQWWDGAAWQSTATTLVADVPDGVNWQYIWDLSPALQDGTPSYTLYATGVDVVGNVGATAIRTNINLDNMGPSIVGAVALNATHVDVTFSESLMPTTPAGLLSAFSFDNGLSATVATLDASGKIVHLVTTAQSIGVNYTVTAALDSITDLVGNGVDLPNTALFLSGAVPNVTVGQGSDPGRPSAEYWATHDATAVADEILISASGGSTKVSTITVRGLDTFVALRSDIVTITLFRDNGDGVFGAGDVRLGSPGVFAADASGTALSFASVNTTVVPGLPANCWIVYKIGPAPGNGHEVGSRLLNADVKCASATVSAFTTITSANLGKTIGIDLVPPSQPATVHANAVATGSVEITWTVSTDVLSGLAWYNVYRDGSIIATSAATTYTATGLNSGQNYVFAISGVDNAGNESTRSTAATVSAPSSAIWMAITTPNPGQGVDIGTVNPGVTTTLTSGTTVTVGGIGASPYSLSVSALDFTNTTTPSVPPTMPASTMSYTTHGWAAVGPTPFSPVSSLVWNSVGGKYSWQQTYVFDYSVNVGYTYDPGAYTTKVTFTATQN